MAVGNELKRGSKDLGQKLLRMRAVADRVARGPRTGLKADKAFFDELSGD